MRILATYISGFHEVIGDILIQKGVAKIHALWDGAVIYENARVIDAGCFNNSFEVLHSQKAQGTQALDSLLSSVLARSGSLRLAILRSDSATSFRLVTSFENQLVSVNPRLKNELETLISKKTHLSLNRAKADIEFWLYARSEGTSFFLRRITYSRVNEKQLQKGELRPELAFLLNWLTKPDPEDVFLDPFCGSGAIPLSRLSMTGFARLYAFDIDPDKVTSVKRRLATTRAANKSQITTGACDIHDLARSIPPGRISKIVTDPPWGFYEACDIPLLYRAMLGAFVTLTSKGACIVLLSARKAEMEAALLEYAEQFQVNQVYNILVSGKKASVYVITRL